MSIHDSFSTSMLRRNGGGPSVNLRSDTRTLTPVFSIVIPLLNEEASLPALIEKIETTLRGQFYEVVLVDDGSTDGTWGEIQIALRRHRNWQAIRLTRRFGHQAALAAGIRSARGRAVIMMDGDGQHPPELILSMVECWRGGAKVVQMIREEAPSASFIKRTTSRLFYRAFSMLSEIPIQMAASDFRLLDRSVVDMITGPGATTPFLRGLVPWLGYRTVDLKYHPRERIGGETKYSLVRMVSLAIHGITSFSIAPLRLATYTGLTFASLSFFYLCYIAFVGIFSPHAVSGWASIAGLVALLGGVQLICMGLIGEYLGRVFNAHLARPPYVIAESLGIQSAVHGSKSNDAVVVDEHGAASRRGESVRLITAHIGEEESAPRACESRFPIASRIEAMRREEADFAPLTT